MRSNPCGEVKLFYAPYQLKVLFYPTRSVLVFLNFGQFSVERKVAGSLGATESEV